MAVLHLISRSPQESRTLEACLARAGEGDAVLLIENAVYAALKSGDCEAVIAAPRKDQGLCLGSGPRCARRGNL